MNFNHICSKIAKSYMQIGDIVEMVWDSKTCSKFNELNLGGSMKAGTTGKITGFSRFSSGHIDVDTGDDWGYNANRFKIIKKAE